MTDTPVKTRKAFYLSLLSGIYFLLIFTGIFARLDSVVFNAIFELTTIPLICLQLFLLAYAINGLARRYHPKVFLAATLGISVLIFLGIFLVK